MGGYEARLTPSGMLEVRAPAGEGRLDFRPGVDAGKITETMSLFCATGLAQLNPDELGALASAWNERHPGKRVDLSDGLSAGTNAMDGEAANLLTFAECVFFGEPGAGFPEERRRRLGLAAGDRAKARGLLERRGLLEPDGNFKSRDKLLEKLSEPLELARAADDVDAMLA